MAAKNSDFISHHTATRRPPLGGDWRGGLSRLVCLAGGAARGGGGGGGGVWRVRPWLILLSSTPRRIDRGDWRRPADEIAMRLLDPLTTDHGMLDQGGYALPSIRISLGRC